MSIPHHVAIIPDGNRRWAKEQGLSVKEGHEKGLSSFRTVADYAADRGVKHLSIWGMSIDNFTKRSPIEVANLLRIFHTNFVSLLEDKDVHERGTRVRIFGHWKDTFPRKTSKVMEEVQEATKEYSNFALNFFLAYNGTNEMMRAVQSIADSAKDKDVVVTPEVIKENLFTKDLPPVDLVIRTGGEPHLSNGFMMWDVADAHLYFTEKYWPSFGAKELDVALEEFDSRERRKGK